MFWSDEELSELQGSMVRGQLPYPSSHRVYDDTVCFVHPNADKIGRSDAEKEYAAKVVPLIQVSSDFLHRFLCRLV